VENLKKIKIYIKSILIPLIVGGIVGILISSKFMDYNTLQKPILSPPSILFPIVWSILYILMGVSYAILKSNNLIDKKINLIYYLQLAFNAMWPILFFILKWRLFSFIWIIILAILIILMIIKFYNKNKVAGLLQIPYLLWVIFASYLNIAFYILNR
jgi:tryptophan-rich sensory protein